MKKTSTLLAGLLAAGSLCAQGSEFSFGLDLGYTSRNVFRGIEKSRHTLTGGVRANYEALYAGVYTAEPLKSDGQGEIDFFFGMALPITDRLSYDLGLTLYYYHEATRKLGQTEYTIEPYLGLTYNLIDTWNASVYFYYDANRETFTAELATGYSWELMERVDFRLSVFYGYVNGHDIQPEAPGPAIHESYHYYGLSAELPIYLAEGLTLTVGVRYGDNISLTGGSAVGETLWGFTTLSYGF